MSSPPPGGGAYRRSNGGGSEEGERAAAKEREEGGGAGGEYISTSRVRARRRIFRPNRTMNWISQKTNGEKEEKTGRVQRRMRRSIRLGQFPP